MGYDSEKREIKMGMLAEKTHPYIRDKVTMIQILTFSVEAIVFPPGGGNAGGAGFLPMGSCRGELLQHGHRCHEDRL